MTPVPYSPDVETPEDGEAETSAGLNASLHDILDITSRDYGHAVRSVHAKSFALLEGTLTIGALPPTLAQGLFAKPGSYKVVLRNSSIAGDILPDAVSLPRGMSVKVLGVEGERLPGSEGDTTQDFIMVNGPAFGAAQAKAFLKNLKLLAATTDKAEGAKVALSYALRGLETVLEAVGLESGLVKTLGGHPLIHPLGDTYYSQTAFRYGDYIAKLSLAPLSANLLALKDKKIALDGRDNALRDETLKVLANEGGEWELRVQLCANLETMPVEDASKVWDEVESPFHVVGRIAVPAQTTWSEARSRVIDDSLSFSVWHGLAAHRPLGAINRVRQSAYAMSSDFRAKFNGCPIHEPSVLAPLPA